MSAPVDGILLRVFVLERTRHKGALVHEWLLEQAKAMGVSGGAAFREIAGFGRHSRLHDELFFELAGDQPVEVMFAMSEEEADRFLALLKAEKLSLFYIKSRAEFGRIGEPSAS